MVNRIHDGTVAVITLHVEVGAPPCFVVLLGANGGLVGAVAVDESIEVGFVGGGRGSLIVQLACPAFHLVKIAIGQAVFFEQTAVPLLYRQIHPPQVAIILGWPTFGGRINHPKMNKMGIRGLYACQIKQLEAH